MTSELSQRIKELYLAAAERAPAERAAFLDEACVGNDGLRARVEALLAQEPRATSFLETPAMECEAKRLAASATPVEATQQFNAGDELGHYRVVALVGRGGMSEVYLAEDARFGRKVALKVLRGDWLDDAERVRRFEQEARAASALNHPNIITVHDSGEVRGQRFMVTEFVEGQSLRQRLRQGALAVGEAVGIGIQLAEALGVAHAAGIVHRDVKPENVMLRADGYVKVLDFGIAKRLGIEGEQQAPTERLTVTGDVLGTTDYLSPEQARGQEVDARTDVFSLGVVLYEMVTGQRPFGGKTRADVVAAILQNEPTPLRELAPDAPFRLERLVTRALRKEATERQPNASEIAAALKLIKENLSGASIDSPPPDDDKEVEFNPLLSEWEAMPRVRAWLRRNPQGGWLALTLSLAALAAILLSHYVGAAGIQVRFAASGCAAPTPLIYGYLVELNAGLFYLIGVPLIVMTGFHLLSFAHATLRRLVWSQRLMVASDKKADPLAIIARLNRRFFRITLPLFALFALVVVGVPEYRGLSRVAFGWVQALYVRDHVGKQLEKLPGKAEVLPRLRRERGCVVTVASVEGGHGSVDRAQWLAPFAAFLAVALGLQMVFIVIVLWLAAKIIFLFVLLIRLLNPAPRDDATLRLRLDFEDEQRRFGLGALDAVHNAFLMMIVLLAATFLLTRLANVPKGTSFFSAQPGWELIGQALLLLVGLSALALLLIGPVVISMRLLETAVIEHLKKLDRQEASLKRELAAARDEQARQELQAALRALLARRELAQQQRAWPRRNSFHRRALLVTFGLLLALPIGIEALAAEPDNDWLYRLMGRLNHLLYWPR